MTESARDTAVHAPLDDCWNRIGTRGDQSCPQLKQYLRCLNCPVFDRAAALLLDRPADIAALPVVANAAENATAGERRAGSLVFRVGAEWLALPAALLHLVGEVRPVHTLPHRRSPAVLGVVNVRGVLTLAVSLAALLNIEAAPASPQQRTGRTERPVRPRLVVTQWRGATTAFPVDDVEGVVYFDARDVQNVPATHARADAGHVCGVADWRGRAVGILDADSLFDGLSRSLQ